MGLLACTQKPPLPKTVVDRFECSRCHVGDGLDEAPRERSCTGCHQAILAGDLADGKYKPDHVADWQKNIRHFVHVPTLSGAGARFEREWFLDFVRHPHDLRPQLESEMPPMPISSAEARELADHFGLVDRDAAPISGDVDRGLRWLGELGCSTCHAFTGASMGPAHPPVVVATPEAMALAPDLRHTRKRMVPSTVDRWLEDSRSIKLDSRMPPLDLDAGTRRDLVAAIFNAPMHEPVRAAAPARLPLLRRPVSHEEVESRVFKKVCWHCHSDPVPMQGEGGPGNTGGFGFKGVGLDLGSRAAILRGKVGPDGERVDLLQPVNGVPRLVRHLLARHAEVAGTPVPGVRGMPMALPPLPMEDIQLVDTWIAQGAPER